MHNLKKWQILIILYGNIQYDRYAKKIFPLHND